MRKLLIIGGGALVAMSFYNYRNSSLADIQNGNNIAMDNLIGGLNKMISGAKTSQAGRDAISAREGGMLLTVYDDGVGIPTVGIGHRVVPADGLRMGDTITTARAIALFESDLSRAENIVARYVKVPLTQNQFDALVSAVFNLGAAIFHNASGADTRLLGALNSGDYTGAAAHFADFKYSGGKVLAGLMTRRASEAAQFLA